LGGVVVRAQDGVVLHVLDEPRGAVKWRCCAISGSSVESDVAVGEWFGRVVGVVGSVVVVGAE
jgi:hypothetical protein